MKTFREFMVIAEGSLGDMSDADFERWVESNRGRGTAAIEAARRRRAQQIKARTVGGPTPQGQPFNPKGRPGSPGNSQGGYATNRGSGRQPPGGQPPTPQSKPPGFRIPRPTAGQVGRGALGAAEIGLTGYNIYTGTKERQSKGEPLATALPKESGKAGSALLAATAASTAASRVLPKNPFINVPGSLVAGALGYAAGDKAAGDIIKKIEDPFGNKAKLDKVIQKRAVQTSRQQASKAGVYGATKGSGIVGTGGPTTFNKAANTITTGGKTAQLPKTQILPGGRVGDLAYRGGKATYLARASVASRDTNVLSRLSRATGIGGQRERDAAASNRERQQAMQNTLKYRQQLGITGTGVSKPPTKPKK